MKKPQVFALVFALSLLQATVLSRFKLFGVAPDALLVIPAISGIFLKGAFALFLSLFAGMLKDILGLSPFGVSTLLFPLWCWLVIKLSQEISLDDQYALSAVAGFLSILNNITSRFLFFYLGKTVSWGVFFRLTVLEAVYAAAASLMIFRILENENKDF